MLKKHIGAGVLALGLLFSVGFVAAPAQAASLTSAQVSAIVGLLQSFGADAGTIANVQAALGGSATSGALSCSSFANVSYGNFDTSPGGPVSQLQSWLGISATSFGFGTYGPKTQAAWNAKCGGSQPTNPVSSNPTGFTASPTSGAAPLIVGFTVSINNFNNSTLNFGDGTTATPSNNADATYDNWSCNAAGPSSTCYIKHLYTSPGTYTASVTNGLGTIIGTATVTVFSGQKGSSTLSATCTGSPYNAGTPGISWGSTPSGGNGSYTYQWTLANDPTGSGDFSNTNQQNVLTTYGSTGTKSATVGVSSGGQSTTANCSATIGGTSTQPSATIDQSTLTQSGSNFTLSGATSASGLFIALVSTTYTGATDYVSISNLMKGSGQYQSVGNWTNSSGGRWSASFNGVTFGTFNVYVYDADGGQYTLLTSSVLSNLASGTKGGSAAFNQNSLSASANAPFTIVGTASGAQSVRVSIGQNNQNLFYSTAVPVTNGQWQATDYMGLSAGSYSIAVIGYSDSAGNQPVSGAGIGGLLVGSTLTVQ